MWKQILRFGTVGGIGFLVDGGLLTLLHAITDWGALWPRAISFPVALSATWYLNRVWTFADEKSDRKAQEYGRYAMVQIVGNLINLAVYATCLWTWPTIMQPYPIIALAVASAVAMIFNYVGARFWVFMGRN